ncbi:MAG: type II secretion system protein [Candidatus Gastranaerophilales bacterium]
MNRLKFNNGFTLAEVLITLGIIGVVSAMTIPNLISSYQSEALDTKKTLFQERLYEAMNQMRFHEKLTGYDNAEDFVTELGKYLKINEICDLDDMSECFPASMIASCDEEILVSDLKDGTEFANNPATRDFSGDNVGIIFADGTKTILNYDKNCEWLDPYESGLNRSEATQCVTLLADVNGNAGKNTVGDDILAINSSFGVYINDICWDLSDTSYSAENTCDVTSSYDSSCTTNNSCSSCTTNYWAGALKACDEANKRLPSRDELLELMSYMYDIENPAWYTVYTANVSADNSAKFSDSFSNQTYYSNEESSTTNMYWIRMYTYETYGGSDKKSDSRISGIRCVSD